jgi:hypothetical protein
MPGAAGAYRGIRATKEQTSAFIGLDHYADASWVMLGEAARVVGNGIGVRLKAKRWL